MKILKLLPFILALCAGLPAVMAVSTEPILPLDAEPNRFLTLKDYISYAQTHNAALKSSYQKWVAATEQMMDAKSMPDPKFSYEKYAQLPDVYERQTVIITQIFPWFGKIRANTRMSMINAEAAKHKYQAARMTLLKDVKNDYYELVYLSKVIEITKENMALMEELSRNIQSESDKIRAQAEINRLKDMAKAMTRQSEQTSNRLKSSMNLPIEINLPQPRQEDFEPESLDYDLLVNILMQKNPELAGLNSKSMAARNKVSLAQKNFYPDIGIGVQLDQMKRPGTAGQDSSRDAMLMLSLRLPVSKDSYRSEQRRAAADAAAIEQQKTEAENNLLTKSSQVYYEYNDSIRRIKLYRETLLPQTKQQLQLSIAAYKAGSADFLSVLDAQKTSLDYHISYQRVLADNRQKLGELEMLTATDLRQQSK